MRKNSPSCEKLQKIGLKTISDCILCNKFYTTVKLEIMGDGKLF